MNKIWILLLCCLLFSCGYSGDGTYKKTGFWPLTNHSLTLPAKDFTSNSEYRFSIKGYESHGTSFLKVNLSSEVPVDFHKLDTELELRISGSINVTHFYRKAPLNSHFTRISKEGENDWPNDIEWYALYTYSDKAVNQQAVPFSTSLEPEKTTNIMYSHSLPTGVEDYLVVLNIGHVPKEFENMQISLELVSGWK